MATLNESFRRMDFSIQFPNGSETDGATRWKEYGATLLKLYHAFAARNLPFAFQLTPRNDKNSLGYTISTQMPEGSTIEDFKARLALFLLPESVGRALDPITVSLANTTSSEVFHLNKTQTSDFIVLNDLALVFAYYQQIRDSLLTEIAGRGLTTHCAVDRGDGESVIRRNHSNPNRTRLVVDEPEEIGQLIMDYDVFRFVPDVNKFGQPYMSRVPIDFDRPVTMGWKEFAEVVNGFCVWLREEGYQPKLRLTGGRGAQVILDLVMDHIAKNYQTPFPRPLKFDSWVRQKGMEGLLSGQATDLVKTLAIAYATHRKHRLGLSAPITVEVHDLSQRYWYILADSSRAGVDTGVVGLGSIHHKTGAVCLPVTTVPSAFGLDHALRASSYPNTTIVDFESRFRSPWIQTVGCNPQLLYEPSTKNPFSLVEETFENHGWIPSQYVRLSSERFMEKYCWS